MAMNIDWDAFFRRNPITPQVDDSYLFEEENEKPHKEDYWASVNDFETDE